MNAMMGTTGAVLVLLGLAACGNGGSAVESRERSGGAGPAALTAGPAPTAEAGTAAPDAARTVVTANRRETVDAKIERLYARNGAAFGARSAQDYLARLTAFTAHPPRDADTVKRPNGDTLIYQASTNTFAVVARDGTPRTMFKPDDGAAYWAQQKERAPTFGRRRASDPQG